MPADLIAVPFVAVITEAVPYTFPVPKEAQPSTSRFGGGGAQRFGSAFAAGAGGKSAGPAPVVTRAVKITSASFTPSPAAASQGKLTSLVIKTNSFNSPAEAESFSIVAFNNTCAAGPSPAVASAASTIQMNMRVFVDESTQFTVTGPGVISLFGEELHETFTAVAKKKKAKKAKLPDGDNESDFDDEKSYGADDMYEQGIVYD